MNREISERERFERNRRRRRAEEKRRAKRNAIIFVIILVLLALAVIFGMRFILNKADKNKTNNDNQDNGMVMVTDVPVVTEEMPTVAPKSSIPEASDASSNNLLDIIMEGGGSHIAYLTFDDGPNDTVTPQILDTLAKYNVKATFFEVGRLIEKNEDMAKRVISEGHLVASHSYTHDYNALYATESSFENEIEKTDKIISDLYDGNSPMKLMRFPGGSYNAGDHAKEKQVYKNTLKGMDYYYCDWNSANGDALGKKMSADELYNYFVSTVSTNNIVVLMHDAETKQATADALPRVIEYLQANDWEFRTLADIPYNRSSKSNTKDDETSTSESTKSSTNDSKTSATESSTTNSKTSTTQSTKSND